MDNDGNAIPNSHPDVPFAFFVDLLKKIAEIPEHKVGSIHARPNHAALKTFRRWVKRLRECYDPLPPGTTGIIFRLLFPEEDARRKYDMQEARLARELCRAFGISSDDRGGALYRWKEAGGSGVLGKEVENVLGPTLTEEYGDESMSLHRLDNLLNELASHSSFSHVSVRQKFPRGKRRDRTTVLRDLFSVSATEAAFLTQIILKNLRPVIYPTASGDYTTALRDYNTKSIAMLTKEQAMLEWDPSRLMLRTFKLRATLEDSAEAFEVGELDSGPVIGSPIQIPKCVKGQGCVHSLKQFKSAKKVWVETKYDGERAQIHVQVNNDRSSRITIYSKSGRDSTLDRAGIHWIIRKTLGLPPVDDADDAQLSDNSACAPRALSVTANVVLEAEMVAFSKGLSKIDEFWRIRSLVEDSASGARSFRRKSTFGKHEAKADDEDSQCSIISNGTDDGSRHLALVFFDVLMLNLKPLLRTPYSRRRCILESLINPIPTFAMLAERTPIPLGGASERLLGEAELRRVFARLNAECQEGAVLKADDGAYNDFKSPWVKLKKDYIPGYGDALDMVVVGASWDQKRANELRVGPHTYTTFYLGALTETKNTRPHFDVWFTACYGLSRSQLEEVNFMIRALEPEEYRSPAKAHIDAGNYTFSIVSGIHPPTVMLGTPLLVEVFGAGFTKAPQCRNYELRFPRITKVFRPSERSYVDAVSVTGMHTIARESVGRDRSSKDAEDCVKKMWGKTCSPAINSTPRKRNREEEWVSKLEDADGVSPSKRYKTSNARSSLSTPVLPNPPPAPTSPTAHGRPVKRSPLGALGSVTNIIEQPQMPSASLYEIAKAITLPSDQHQSAQPNISVNQQNERPRGIHLRGLGITSPSITLNPDMPTSEPFDKLARHVCGDSSDAPSHKESSPHLTAASTPLSSLLSSRHEGLPTLSPVQDDMLPTPPTSPPLALNDDPPPSATPISTPPTPAAPQVPQNHKDSALYRFLDESLIWLTTPAGLGTRIRPAWRPSLKAVLPPARRVHGFNAFLMGCGWDNAGTGPCGMVANVVRGIIFVDDDEPWMEDVAWERVNERGASLVKHGQVVGARRIPIYAFKESLLSYERLATGCEGVDVLKEALFVAEFED